MPLWKVYHPVGAYSAQDKKEFAEKVTEMYSRIPIPKFYVVMIFEEVAAEQVYVGGVSHGKFVRFKLDHMARTLPGPILREWWVKAVDQLIAPYVRDRGYDWEVTIARSLAIEYAGPAPSVDGLRHRYSPTLSSALSKAESITFVDNAAGHPPRERPHRTDSNSPPSHPSM